MGGLMNMGLRAAEVMRRRKTEASTLDPSMPPLSLSRPTELTDNALEAPEAGTLYGTRPRPEVLAPMPARQMTAMRPGGLIDLGEGPSPAPEPEMLPRPNPALQGLGQPGPLAQRYSDAAQHGPSQHHGGFMGRLKDAGIGLLMGGPIGGIAGLVAPQLVHNVRHQIGLGQLGEQVEMERAGQRQQMQGLATMGELTGEIGGEPTLAAQRAIAQIEQAKAQQEATEAYRNAQLSGQAAGRSETARHNQAMEGFRSRQSPGLQGFGIDWQTAQYGGYDPATKTIIGGRVPGVTPRPDRSQQMTPYQERSLGLREEELNRGRQKDTQTDFEQRQRSAVTERDRVQALINKAQQEDAQIDADTIAGKYPDKKAADEIRKRNWAAATYAAQQAAEAYPDLLEAGVPEQVDLGTGQAGPQLAAEYPYIKLREGGQAQAAPAQAPASTGRTATRAEYDAAVKKYGQQVADDWFRSKGITIR